MRKILFLVLCFWLALCQELLEHKGMMLSYSKQYLALDLFELTKAMLNNIKHFNFKNITKEKDSGPFKIFSHIYNIKIEELKSTIGDIPNNTHYSHNDRKFSIKSNNKIINYTLAFSWKLVAMDMTIGFGEGEVKLVSKSLSMYVILPQPNKKNETFNGEINIDFDLNDINIEGMGVTEDIKQWITSQINNTIKELSNAITSNKEYIKNNFASSFRRTRGIVNKNNLLFENEPLDTKVVNNYLWISFQTRITLSDKKLYMINNSYYVSNVKPKTGLGVYLSFEHIVGVLKLVYIDEVFDIEPFDSSGTIRDLFVVMPELFVRYKPNDLLNVTCRLKELSQIPVHIYTNVSLQCCFDVAGDVLLSAAVETTLMFIPKATNKQPFFTSLIKEANLETVDTEPSNVEIAMLTSQFFLKYLKKKLTDPMLHLKVPNIKYDLRRDKYVMEVIADMKHYIAYYDFGSII